MFETNLYSWVVDNEAAHAYNIQGIANERNAFNESWFISIKRIRRGCWNTAMCKCFGPSEDVLFAFTWLTDRPLCPARYLSYDFLKLCICVSLLDTALFGLAQPRYLCRVSLTWKKLITPGPGPTHPPSCFHFPPLAMCLNRSMSEICIAMSRLGDWWLLWIEQALKTAL